MNKKTKKLEPKHNQKKSFKSININTKFQKKQLQKSNKTKNIRPKSCSSSTSFSLNSHCVQNIERLLLRIAEDLITLIQQAYTLAIEPHKSGSGSSSGTQTEIRGKYLFHFLIASIILDNGNYVSLPPPS